MKNVNEFMYAKFNTLTDTEWGELAKLVDKICDAHEDDEWWKVENCIKACVNIALSIKEDDDAFAELCREESNHE